MSTGEVFDKIAYEYHDARPAYPKGIIDAFVAFGDIPVGGHVLEMGSGSGIATRLLARRGLQITAVEPGPALMGIARTELNHWPDVDFVQSTFLDAELEGPYDAALAATSWRWLGDRPAVEEKVHGLLGEGGHLGIMQNTTAVSDGKGDAFFRASRRVYAEHMGTDPNDTPPAPERLEPERLNKDLFRLAFFGCHVRYDRYDPEEYTHLVGTYGEIASMKSDAREALLADLRRLIVTQFDGIATMAHATTLTVLQRI